MREPLLQDGLCDGGGLGGERAERGQGRRESLLNAYEVASVLGVKKAWVYAETRAGRIPHVKLGRYYRYRPEAIARWLEEIETTGAHEFCRG